MTDPNSITEPNSRNTASVPILSLRSISKSFRGREILRDLSLDVEENEFIAILGASGSGKSTFLNLIAGLELPDRGELKIRGNDALPLQPNDRDCAFSFQSNACYDHWTVHQNLYHFADPSMKTALPDLIDAMELQPILTSKPPKLSGGELGRVSLLRTLVSSKHFLLLDEPLAQLNPRFRAIAKEAITNVHRDRNHTTIYVTHDLNEAMLLADRIVFLKDGRIAGLSKPRDMYEMLLKSCEEYASAGVRRSHLAICDGRVVLPRQWKVCAIRTRDSGEMVFDDAPDNVRDQQPPEYQLLDCRWGSGYWELALANSARNIGQTAESTRLTHEPEILIVHVLENPWLPKKLAHQLRELERGIRDEVTVRISHEGAPS